MKRLMTLTLLALPFLSFAGERNLPEPRKGEEVCFSRVLSNGLLAKRGDIRIKAIAVTLERDKEFDYNVYSKILVVRTDGEMKTFVGVLKSSLPAKQASFELEGTQDSLVIAQEQMSSRVRIKIDNIQLINKVNSWLSGTKADSGMKEITSMALRKAATANDLDKNGYNKKSCSELLLAEIGKGN